MGAEFLEVKIEEEGEGGGGYAKEMSPAFIAAEMALFAAQAKDVDIIITTALIPATPGADPDHRRDGAAHEEGLRHRGPGGGKRRQLRAHATRIRSSSATAFTIIGYIDLPSRLAPTASLLYGNNLAHLLADMGGAANFHIDLNDEVVRGATRRARRRSRLAAAAPRAASRAGAATRPRARAEAAPPKDAKSAGGQSVAAIVAVVAGGALLALGLRRAAGVPVAPHGVRARVLRRLAGRLERHAGAAHPADERHQRHQRHHRRRRDAAVSGPPTSPVADLGAAAMLLATINIAGGFLVTQRMLRMFRR